MRHGLGARGEAIRTIPGGGGQDGLRAPLAAPGAAIALALEGGFGAYLLARPNRHSRHRDLFGYLECGVHRRFGCLDDGRRETQTPKAAMHAALHTTKPSIASGS